MVNNPFFQAPITICLERFSVARDSAEENVDLPHCNMPQELSNR
jgi:hypothetical protein